MAETPKPATSLPLSLDPRKVFRQRLEIEGEVAVSALSGLCESLLDTEGVARASLHFLVDEERRLRIQGQVSAEVNVVCQRCLKPMTIQLHDTVDLVMISSEAQVRTLPAALDPWLCAEDESLVPARIVEEQLILAMPIVTMHEQCVDLTTGFGGAAEAAGNSSDAQQALRNNPFAVLAGLKSGPDKSGH
jgi:uncharacterized protein